MTIAFGLWVHTSELGTITTCDLGIKSSEPKFVTSSLILGELIENLRAMGWRDKPVVLLLDSFACLPVILEKRDAQTDREANTFAIEDSLPIDAETFAADFTRTPHGLLAVATSTDWLAPLLIQLEGAGIDVPWIIPTSLAIAQTIQSQEPTATQAGLVCADGDNCELVVWEKGLMVDWFRTTWQDLKSSRELMNVDSNISLTVVAKDGQSSVEPIGIPGFSLQTTKPIRRSITSALTALASEAWTPWINLRLGRLAPTDQGKTMRQFATTVLFSVLLVLVTLSLVFLVRGWQFRSMLAKEVDAQREEYVQAFPTETPPLGIVSRLESKVRDRNDRSGDQLDVSKSHHVASHLLGLLQSVPPETRLNIKSLNMNQNDFHVTGEIVNQSSFEQLVTSLKARGLQLPSQPIVTQSDTGTLTFDINARLLAPIQAEGK
jgi:type II secretory pathway component PulL